MLYSCTFLRLFRFKLLLLSKKLKKIEQNEHEEICGNEIIPCDLCKENLKRKKIDDH